MYVYLLYLCSLRKEDPPECTACQMYSFRHVLIDYFDLPILRPRFYNVPDLKTYLIPLVSTEFYH